MNEEYQALETLVNSEGWRLLVAHTVVEFGDKSTLDKLEADLKGVPKADEAGQRATVMRHLDGRAIAHAILAWPTARMEAHRKAQQARAERDAVPVGARRA